MIQLNLNVMLLSASAFGAQMQGNQPFTFGNQPNPNQHLVPQLPGFIEGVHGIVMNLTGNERCYVKRRASWISPYEPRIISEVPMNSCLGNSQESQVSREAILNRAAVGDGVFVYQWEKEAIWKKGTCNNEDALAPNSGLLPSDFWTAVPLETEDLHIYWGAGINDGYVIGIPSDEAVKANKLHELKKVETQQPKKATKPRVAKKMENSVKSLKDQMSHLSLKKIQKKSK